MSYAIKSIFYTLQGEGGHTGRPAVFVRFSGCNLWSGREEDRINAICRFCDTDFVGTDGPGGGRFPTASILSKKVTTLWPDVTEGKPFVVCTGGEPLLQLDQELVNALHNAGFEVAIETNGTMPLPQGIDWVCVSPKASAALKITKGNELKLIFPQSGTDPADFLKLDFDHFRLQPMDGPELQKNTRLAIDYCLEHPKWTLSLQTHKILHIT